VTAYYEPLGTADAVRPEDEAVLAAVMRIAADPAAWRPQRR
jgi:beta-lactamase class A